MTDTELTTFVTVRVCVMCGSMHSIVRNHRVYCAGPTCRRLVVRLRGDKRARQRNQQLARQAARDVGLER